MTDRRILEAVIPAQAGIQKPGRGSGEALDPRLRGDDDNKPRQWLRAVVLALMLPLAALAQTTTDTAPLQFDSRAEAERFHALTEELRCVKCQNQSLADSNAAIAHDLRREVLALMREGKSNDEVKHYLVARYGEFVLYRPRVEPTTWLLWFGPALLLLVGGFVVAGIVRKRGAGKPPAVDDQQEW